MKIKESNIEWTPQYFIPNGDKIKVFIDVDSNNVLACGSIDILRESEKITKVLVWTFEAYGGGSGRAVIDYLKSLNKKVIIKGFAIDGSEGFWTKMGATISNGNFEIERLN